MDNPAVWAEIDDLRKLKTAALRTKYQEVFGAATRSSNKQFLFRCIAWRLQARAEGDLSERARRRASEIADDAELRLRAPRDFAARLRAQSRPATARPRRPRDGRLPQAGTILTRVYRGQSVVAHVRDDGFEYQGRHYRSLSAIAREATGTRWNGLAFFGLTERRHG
jgi:hypothetical protein